MSHDPDRVRPVAGVRHMRTDRGSGSETAEVAAPDTARTELVAHEEPLELQVNGASVAVVMRTPGDDEELGLGFLLTERIVADASDVEFMRHCTRVPHPEAEENVLQIRLRPHVLLDLDRLRRHTFASSSCGVCGKATIDNACALAPPLHDHARVTARVLAALPPRLRDAQHAFALTGGLHGAALFALDSGALVVVREDVGRHNAVDKVVGHGAMRGLTLGGHGLLVSGRVGFELVQKAAVARIPIIAGISAPTSLAVRMGEAMGVSVVGFLRGASMNVYAGRQRVVP